MTNPPEPDDTDPMTHPDRPATSSAAATSTDRQEALIAALVDLERHVAQNGWDQAPRLFALAVTDELIAAEPLLAQSQQLRGTADGALPGALTAIEQDEFSSSGDPIADLEKLQWPKTVFGCAISLERTFLPAGTEATIPEDPVSAAEYVSSHPQREDIRVVVGVNRVGERHGVARLVSQPDQLLAADDLVPGLADVLAHTLA